MKNKKWIIAALIASALLAAGAIAASTQKNDTNVETVEYPHYNEMYGIEAGHIVKLDLESSNTQLIQRTDEAAVDGTITSDYIAYTTADDGFVKYNLESAEEIDIEAETPAFYTMNSMDKNNILYLVSDSEHLEHEEESNENIYSPHDIYFSQIKILNLDDDTSITIQDESGENPLRADIVDLSPDKKQILASDIEGNTFLYDHTGKLIQTLDMTVSKIGFLNDSTIWFSDILGPSENKDQHLKLYNIESGETEDLYDKNEELSKISILDFKQVGHKYVLLGNSYKEESPKQTIYQMDSDYQNLTGIVNLTSLSLNSNGKIFPIAGNQYMVDVRSSSNYQESATFRLNINQEDAAMYRSVSQIFGK